MRTKKALLRDLDSSALEIELGVNGHCYRGEQPAYIVEVKWNLINKDYETCEFYVAAYNYYNWSYVTTLNCILGVLKPKNDLGTSDGSKMLVTRKVANKLMKTMKEHLKDPVWCKQLKKELDEDNLQGWEQEVKAC